MAGTDADADPTVSVGTTELKKQLLRMVQAIVDDDDDDSDHCVDVFDEAKSALEALKEAKMKKLSFSAKSREAFPCPDHFKCPISNELMRDPVILSSGKTYDRPFIQKWLKAGNRTCPVTEQVLSHSILIPNQLIMELIAQWGRSHGIVELENHSHINRDGLTEGDRERLVSLLAKMSATLPEQKMAAKELRLLTKRMSSFRALFGESVDAIPQLLNPLSGCKSEAVAHQDLQEDVITTILNLSIHDNNKKLIAESPMAVPLLLDALRTGNIETRANAAAAIFTLSALDSNKALIGNAGALKPLVDLLEARFPSAMKDAASAIFNLCTHHENKVRAIRDGALKVILKCMEDSFHVDELLPILALLSNHQNAIAEFKEIGAVPFLLRVARESDSERNKENSIVVLHTICLSDRTTRREMREEEKSRRTFSQLACDGTPRARRKADAVLAKLNIAVNKTHSA